MASPSSTVEFLELVRKSGIYRAENLDERLQDVPGLSGDPVQSAAVLVQHGLLTRFQAKLLLTGRYKGFRLGAYVIREQIGQGGMGAVYLAEHETLRRRVAIKVLTPPKDDVSGRLTVERFLREARAAAALDHPNIVRIHDVAQQGEVHYLVMEYVDGQTLDQILEKGGPITPSRAVAYVAQAAAGLQHAHEKGFVHRDIKPANLILSRDGTVKILDMGLARSFTAENDKLTEVMDQGAILGTADFISPEQAMNAPGIDIRADVYSLGATFFALVTGKPPFSGNTTQKLIQHQMKDAPDLTALDKTFPPELAAVASKMLHKKPEKRYQTPAEVIGALAPWLNEDGGTKVMAGISGTDMGNTGELQTAITEIVGGTKSKRVGTRRMTEAQKRWSGRLVLFGVAAPVTLAFILFGYVVFVGGSDRDKQQQQQQTVARNPGSNPAQKTSPPKAAPSTTVARTTPPRGTRPISAVARPTGKTVFNFDAASIPEFQFSIRGSAVTAGTRPALPSWINLHCWKPESDGEFTRTVVDDKPVLGLANRDGEASTQFAIELTATAADVPLTPDGEYTFRIEYLTRNGANGNVHIQNRNRDWAIIASQDLPDTGGQWKTVTGKFHREGSDPVQLAVNAHNSADGMLYIRSIQVIDPKARADAQPALLKLEFDRLKPEVVEVRGSTAFGDRFGRQTLPQGLGLNHFDAQSEAEYAIADVGGARAFGLKNTGGPASGTQVIYDGPATWSKVPTGETITFRLTYQYEGPAAGLAQVQLQKDPWTKQTMVELTPTGGAWQTVELSFTRPDDNPYSLVVNTGNSPGGSVWIRSVEAWVGAPPAAAATASLIYRLDLSAQKAFTKRGTVRKKPADPVDVEFIEEDRTGDGDIPAGWVASPWDREAEFLAEVHAGSMALGIRHTGSGRPSGMLFTPDLRFPSTRARARFEYLTDGPVGGVFKFRQSQPTIRTAWNIKQLGDGTNDLPGTNGTWQTAELDVDLEGATGGYFEFHNNDASTSRGFWLRSLEILDPDAAAAAPAPARDFGKLLFSFGAGAMQPGKYTVENRQNTGDSFFPNGFFGHCWRAESIAEFRCGAVAGSQAFGVTNFNDNLSSQILVFLEGQLGVALDQGKEYRVRVDYRTANDAEGKVLVREPGPSYRSLAETALARGGDAWKSAEFTFQKDSDLKLELMFENTSVGEGNTLWVRKFEVFEVK